MGDREARGPGNHLFRVCDGLFSAITQPCLCVSCQWVLPKEGRGALISASGAGAGSKTVGRPEIWPHVISGL